MIRIFLLLSLIFLFYIKLFACSFVPDSFCSALDKFPDNVVLYGEIISVNRTELRLEVIDVLKGQEYRQVISIREADGFFCMLDY